MRLTDFASLNRLTQYAVGNAVTGCTSSQNQKTVSYDNLGNIASKTGVGTYSSGNGAGPHAVTSIAGTVNGVVNPTYGYDANGNMSSGAGRTITPTAFNMAASIVQGSTTVSFTYDSQHARVKMVAPSGTTYYLNDPATGTMSEKLVSGSNTTWHDYMAADGHIVAEKFSGATSAVRYFVSDHLGSTAAVTNEAAAVVERNAYDPWGKRRNLDGSDDTSCALSSLTTRGFTGHEHIDSECLINMNARVFDPTIGRFMTADSVVPHLWDSQSFNRYSYVNNRPLSFIDPSGHQNVESDKTKRIPKSGPPCYGCYGMEGEIDGQGNYQTTAGLTMASTTLPDGRVYTDTVDHWRSFIATQISRGYTIGGNAVQSDDANGDADADGTNQEPIFAGSDGLGIYVGRAEGEDIAAMFASHLSAEFNDHFTTAMMCFGVCAGYGWTGNDHGYFLYGFGTPELGLSRQYARNADDVLKGGSVTVSYLGVTGTMSTNSINPASDPTAGGYTLGTQDATSGVSWTWGQPTGSAEQNLMDFANWFDEALIYAGMPGH